MGLMFRGTVSFTTSLTLTAVALIWLVWGLRQGRAGDQVQAELERRITLKDGIPVNTPLKDALAAIRKVAHVKFRVDGKAFERKLGVQEIEEQPIRLARMRGVRLGTILQVVLEQVVATYSTEGDVILIVPAGKRRNVEPMSRERAEVEKRLRRKLASKVTLEEGVKPDCLADALEAFGERFDLNIAIGSGPYPGERALGGPMMMAMPRYIGHQGVELPKTADAPLGSVLRSLLEQVDGDYEIHDNLILVVPRKSKKR
jgi:hypothetical protein